jgi:hypothetical protein
MSAGGRQQGEAVVKKWWSFLVKQVPVQPGRDGWYETSTDGFATTLVLYWRGDEWVAAPDSPSEKGHIRQDRLWRLPS